MYVPTCYMILEFFILWYGRGPHSHGGRQFYFLNCYVGWANALFCEFVLLLILCFFFLGYSNYLKIPTESTYICPFIKLIFRIREYICARFNRFFLHIFKNQVVFLQRPPEIKD